MLALESRYAKPRSADDQCVDGYWFDIKNMGVSEGAPSDAAGIRARHARSS